MPYRTHEPPSDLRVSQETPGDWVEITLADTGGGFRITGTLPRGGVGFAAAYDETLDAFLTVHRVSNAPDLITPWSAVDGRLLWDHAHTLPAAHDNAFGICVWDLGGVLFVGDRSDDKIFAYDLAKFRAGRLVRAHAWDIALDDANDTITDMTTDGATLWVLEASTTANKVYEYSLAAGTYGDHISAGDFNLVAAITSPASISYFQYMASASVHTRLAILDTVDERVYVYDTGGSRVNNDEFVLDPSNTSDRWVTADAIDETTRFWVGDFATRTTFAYTRPGVAVDDDLIHHDRDDRLAKGIYATGATDGVLSLRLADSELTTRSVPITAEAIREAQCTEARSTGKTGFDADADYYAVMYGGQPYSSDYRRL